MSNGNSFPNIQKVIKNPQWEDYWPGIILGGIIVIVVAILIFNYFRGTNQGEIIPIEEETTQEELKESQMVPVPLPTTHKVVAGDSLVKMADRYYQQVDLWPGIAKENNLENPSLIKPDTEIEVPTKESALKTHISELRKTPRDAIAGNKYTVDYGDTLFEIAQRAYGDGSKWTLIDQANSLGRLPNGNPLIHAGNVLIIPR